MLVLDKYCTEKVTEAGTVRPFCGDEEISVENVLNVFFPYRNVMVPVNFAMQQSLHFTNHQSILFLIVL